MIRTAAAKAEHRRTQTLARRWAHLKRTIEKFENEMSGVSKRLIRTMKRGRRTRLEAGDDLIQLIIQRQKRVTKGDLVKLIGKEKADVFWGTLPDRICEYLSFVNEKNL
jgi:hypothetical protein